MRNNTGFFKRNENRERGWIWNGYRIEILGGTEREINDNNYIITPGIQKVLVDSKYKTATSVNDKDKVVFRDKLRKTYYYDRIPRKGRMSGCDRHIKNDLDNDVRKILNSDTKLSGRGIEKLFIPSNVIDIYTRFKVLLGMKLSGHTDTLTEASNSIDELYKTGETQNEPQYCVALDNFQT